MRHKTHKTLNNVKRFFLYMKSTHFHHERHSHHLKRVMSIDELENRKYSHKSSVEYVYGECRYIPINRIESSLAWHTNAVDLYYVLTNELCLVEAQRHQTMFKAQRMKRVINISIMYAGVTCNVEPIIF